MPREITGSGTIIDLPIELKCYRFSQTIGRGPNSIVKLAEDIDKDMQYAIKIMPVMDLEKAGIYETVMNDVKTKLKFDSTHILKIYDHFIEDGNIYIVMEYCKKNTLYQHISENGPPSENECRTLFKNIVESVAYLHSKNLAHRSISLESFLINEKGEIKLSSFKTAHQIIPHQLLVTQCGSPLFAPPEVIRNQPYDGEKADIWALGIILYSMFVGNLPWNESNPSKLLSKIAVGEYEIPSNASPLLADLISMLLEMNPSRRPSALDILRHPWFQMLARPQKKLSTIEPTRSFRNSLESSKTYYSGRNHNSNQTKIILKPKITSLKELHLIKSDRSASNVFSIPKKKKMNIQNKDPVTGNSF